MCSISPVPRVKTIKITKNLKDKKKEKETIIEQNSMIFQLK